MKIGLCMIVRDEAHCIERCLRSVRPIITSWTICDTGSTDETKAIVARVLHDLPGELHDDEWVHFAHNRTLAIQRACARRDADYILVIDADHEWHGTDLGELTADCYMVEHRHQTLRYGIPCLMKADKEWSYKCPIHETVQGVGTGPTQMLSAKKAWVQVYPEGARSRDPRKFEKDAAVLLKHVAENPDDCRATFYLAQSYRDAATQAATPEDQDHFRKEARAWYQRRAEMENGWWEERWHACYQYARLAALMNLPFEVVMGDYMNAYQANPSRAEPLYGLAIHARLGGYFGIGTMAARQGMAIPTPNESHLFVESFIYEWGAQLEFSISAFYVPVFKDEGLKMSQHLLRQELPPHIRQCVEQNVGLYKKAA